MICSKLIPILSVSFPRDFWENIIEDFPIKSSICYRNSIPNPTPKQTSHSPQLNPSCLPQDAACNTQSWWLRQSLKFQVLGFDSGTEQGLFFSVNSRFELHTQQRGKCRFKANPYSIVSCIQILYLRERHIYIWIYSGVVMSVLSWVQVSTIGSRKRKVCFSLSLVGFRKLLTFDWTNAWTRKWNLNRGVTPPNSLFGKYFIGRDLGVALAPEKLVLLLNLQSIRPGSNRTYNSEGEYLPLCDVGAMRWPKSTFEPCAAAGPGVAPPMRSRRVSIQIWELVPTVGSLRSCVYILPYHLLIMTQIYDDLPPIRTHQKDPQHS
jgi:hypothetical protein